MHRNSQFNSLVPELLIRDFARSQAFYGEQLGFRRLYGRDNPSFAYLEIDGAQLMIEQLDDNSWLTADMAMPFGRGINLQIEVRDIDGPVERLRSAGWPLFKQPEDVWYWADDRLFGQRQFLVQDPDGYLLRFCRDLGIRAAADIPSAGRIVT
ncbi:MAG: bleomycin resistance protein [Dongiaceae bacterium]